MPVLQHCYSVDSKRKSNSVHRSRPAMSIAIASSRTVENLERRVMLTADVVTITAANALQFIGSSDNNNVTVSYAAGTYTIKDSIDAINVTNGGSTVVTGSSTPTITATGVTSLSFDTGGGSDTFNVESIANPTAITNTTAAVAQSVNAGSAGSLQGIGAALSVHNSKSYTDLTLDDSADSVGSTINLSGTEITGIAPAAINFDAGILSALDVLAGSGGNTITISGTPYSIAGAVTTTLDSGTGSDSVYILATSGTDGANLIVNGHEGFDTVVVSNSGSVQNILGQVTLTNATGLTDLTVDDSGDLITRSATITSSQITGLAPATIDYSSLGDLALTVDGGSGGNTFNFSGTGASFSTDLNTGPGADSVFVTATAGTLNIDGEGGQDSVTVGGVSGFGIQEINGEVSVTNDAGSSSLTLDDSQDFDPVTATLDVDNGGNTASVTGLAPNTIDFTPSQTSGLTIDGGTGGNTFDIDDISSIGTTTINTGEGGTNTVDVTATAAGGTLDINGQDSDDTVDVGSSTQDVQSISGTVDVTNATGATSLVVDDALDTTGRTMAITSSSITGLAPAAIDYTTGQVNSVQITGGSSSDAFNVSPAKGVSFNLDGADPTPPALPGDALNLNLIGITGAHNTDTVSASGHAGTWIFTNASTVTYSDFETLFPSADLSVTVSGNPIAAEGGLLVYNFSMTNAGPNIAPNATLTSNAGPLGNTVATYVAGVPYGFPGSSADLGTLAVGATISGTIVVNAVSAGYLGESVTASSDYPDLNLTNNSQVYYTTVIGNSISPTGGRSLNMTAGQTFSGEIGTFTSANPNATPSDFSAEIDFGDGSPETAGTIAIDGAGFQVLASHQYTIANTDPIEVHITAEGGATATDNGSVTITAAAPSQLVFTQQPASATAGAGFSTPFIVQVQDVYGNLVKTDTSTIMLTTAFAPTNATTGISMSAKAVGGVATFTDFKLTVAGLYVLQATDGLLASATSLAVSINPAAASKLAFSAEPSSAKAGTTFSPAFAVYVEDQYGNVVTTDSSSVIISLASGPSGAKLNGTATVAASDGVATFSNLSLTVAGTYTLKVTDGTLSSATSANLTITAAAASKLVFATQATSASAGSSFSPAFSVKVEDGYGNLVTTDSSTVTIAIASGPSGAKLSGILTQKASKGIATFSGLSLTVAGQYTLKATDGSLKSVTSSTLTILSTAATKLVFNAQAFTAIAGTSVSPGFTVSVEDAFGNVVTTNSSSITLAIESGPSDGAITGTTTVKAYNGVASFYGISFKKAGVYVLKATGSYLATATSMSITIEPAAASDLIILQQPTSGAVNAGLAPSFIVDVVDAFGNLVTNNISTMTVSIGVGPVSGKLRGTLMANLPGGVFKFSNLSLNKSGNYKLTFADGAFNTSSNNIAIQ